MQSIELPPTTMRVARNTDERINEQIQRQIEANVLYFAERLDEIDRRIQELDREWDVERTLETNASALALAGLTLGVFDSKWLVLPVVVAGFLLQHALQGWCPPVPILRRLGVRTEKEIMKERYALKALRGDFQGISNENGENALTRAGKAIRAAD